MNQNVKFIHTRIATKLYKVIFTLIIVAFLGFEICIQTKAAQTSVTVDQAISWCESKLGKKIGTGQCVALIQEYYKYLGASAVSGNACDYATNSLPSGWSRVKGGTPQKGDILVYTGAKYGHVAIYAGGTTSYHQNMSGKYVEKKTSWKYNNSWYSTAEGGTKSYWGYIRPNWKGSKPSQPTIKSWTAEGMNSVTIKWGSVSGATSYKIERRKKIPDVVSDYTTIKSGVTGTSFTDTGLETATIYYYKVTAVNSAGSSKASGSCRVWTRSKAPTVTAIGPTSIKISWDAVMFAGSYRIDRREVGDNTEYTTIKTGITGTSYTDSSGLKPNTAYYYRVYPVGTDDIDNITVRSETSSQVRTWAAVTGVSLNKTTATYTAGEVMTLKATVSPSNAGNKNVTWSSSNTTVATVNSSGHVEFLKAGEVTVTVKTAEGNKTAVCRFTVIEPKGFSLTGKKTIEDGEYRIRWTGTNLVWDIRGSSAVNGNRIEVQKEDTSDAYQVYIFTYKDGGYYTLQNKGSSQFAAVGSGNSHSGAEVLQWPATNGSDQLWQPVPAENGTYILVPKCATSRVADVLGAKQEVGSEIALWVYKGMSNQKYELVPVKIYAKGITLDTTEKKMVVGTSGSIRATINPASATDKTITWSSSDNSVASVDGNGNIKALKVGSSVITAMTKDGGRKASCTVTVTEPKHYIDLNGMQDGEIIPNLGESGTADIYINGELKADDVKDYYAEWPEGTTYEIRDIKTTAGWQFNGAQNGNISGTVGNGNVSIVLMFTTEAERPSEGEGKVTVAHVSGGVGMTLAVPINLEVNPGIVGISLDMGYDNTRLKLVKVESGQILDGSLMLEDYTKNPYRLSLSNDMSTADTEETGVLATAYFEILSGEQGEEIPVELSFREAYDKDLNEVEFRTANGKISIASYIPGDVNRDGQVKLNDAIILRRYVAGWDLVIDELAADVNRDGQVKLNDAIILRRFVAGWDVVLK